MTSTPDRRRARRGLATLAVAFALVATGCGSSATTSPDGAASSATEPADAADFRDTIQGLQRDDPLDVSGVTLPEVAEDATTTPFRFVAPTGDLLFVAFGYTNCPDVCPTTLSDIRKALDLLDPDEAARVEVAFATVDPERDTAEVMSGYLASFVADGHPLRPSSDAELTAAQAPFNITSSVTKTPEGRTEVTHTAKSFVIDDQGHVVVEWAFGTGADAMASDLRLLLQDR